MDNALSISFQPGIIPKKEIKNASIITWSLSGFFLMVFMPFVSDSHGNTHNIPYGPP
jgi:hypothetical protein